MQEISSNRFIPPHPLKTAVLFLVFNRPDTTKQVFEAIRQAKPPKLYVAADGPRAEKPGEAEKCEKVRQIATQVDWDCDVKTLFRDKNLGCRMGVSSAIDWFFENEEEGIILEDDCLPSLSFFWFCEELLERYRRDMRVGQISGFNYGYKNKDLNYDYFFSKYPMIWGWATWKNRWENYSLVLENFEEIKNNKQFELIFSKKESDKRLKIFTQVKAGLIDTWDYQWSFTLYKNSQFTIIPRKNFILNLGFDNDSTHTAGKNPYEKLKLESLVSIIKHPNYIIQFKDLYKQLNNSKNIIKRIFNRVLNQ